MCTIKHIYVAKDKFDSTPSSLRKFV